jgi:proline iminopeptidase
MKPDTYTISEEMLAVGDGHTLYVQEWGKQNAKQTFLFLHGGPGSGCNDGHKALFNGSRDHVVFFDQRGAGRSIPAGSLVANTTEHLVQDIQTILDHFALNQVVIVGDSWGSTLALAYALAHPERVSAMVLRGIFTGTKREIDYLNKGAFRIFFPEVWEAFVARTPEAYREDPAAYHTPRATGDDQAAVAEAAYAYSELESSVSMLDDRRTAGDRATFNPNGSRIEIHYLQNQCFIEDEYILSNAHRLLMPVWIVQGRYDMVCPPITAYELDRVLPTSELIFTISGHSGNDRGNQDIIKTIINTIVATQKS